MLQNIAYAISIEEIDDERAALLSELEEVNIGDLIDAPAVNLERFFLSLDQLPSTLKTTDEYERFAKKVSEIKNEKISDLYVSVSNFISPSLNEELAEWLSFFKADLLFQVHEKKEAPQWSFVSDEYEAAIRQFPLSTQIPRALYQLALVKLQSGLYQETAQIISRALNDFPENLYAPNLRFVMGEQFFRSSQLDQALTEFSNLVRRHPRSIAAIEAAFRRAYLLFRQENFELALQTYEDLEKFHSSAFQQLQMKREPSSADRFRDRALYAESLYLNKKYTEASDMFQSLANLFPRHELSGVLWIRFGDTYFHRGRAQGAYEIYRFVKDQKEFSVMARSLATLRMADTNFMLKNVRSQTDNPDLYESAYQLAKEGGQDELASLAILKEALFYRARNVLPKAKHAIERHQREFPVSKNIEWVNQTYTYLVEMEILDHYKAEDYLAALTIYLVKNRNSDLKFGNVEVLLLLSKAARSLRLLGEAEEILNRVIYLESSTEVRQEALLSLVDLLIERNELKKASERLRRFNFAYPKTPLKYLYHQAWANLYAKLDNAEKAVEHFGRAIRLAGDDYQAKLKVRQSFIKKAEFHQKLNEATKAIRSYRDFIELYNEQEEAIKLGTVPFTSKDAFHLKVARYRIADLFFSMKDYVRALQAYQKVKSEVKDEPFSSHAQYRIGECYLALNDRSAALEAFGQVQSENPENLWVRASESYIKSVQMEVENGIRIFN